MPGCIKLRLVHLLICLLVLNVIALGGITAIAVIAASTRSDCSSSSSSSSTTGIVEIASECNNFEKLSSLVRRHASYFQSAHAFLSQSITTLSLMVFQPSLVAMVWSSLNTGKLSVSSFGRDVDFANGPNPSYIINYLGSQPPPVTFQVIFVVFMSAMSQAFTFMVSPIYRTHKAPFTTEVRIVNGGGIDTSVEPLFDPWDNPTPRGVIAGESLISGQALANTGVPQNRSYLDHLVFIPSNSTQAIWNGRVNTVSVKPSIDCSLAAANNLTQTSTPAPLVTLDPSTFFAADGWVGWTSPHPSFAGVQLGALGNDPTLATVYLNASSSSGPGFVTGNASVIFLAANGTIEGAQQRLTSPNPTSRIKSADALACISTVRLEVSVCTIDLGNVTSCDFSPPSDASSFPFGGVEKFVNRAADVAITLAVSPALAIPPWYNVIPTYDITPGIVAARVIPLALMSTNESRPYYNIPLSYVQDVLFGQVMRLMVEGMLSVTDMQTSTQQQVSVISTYGASSPILAYIVMASGFLIAVTALISTYVAGDPPKFDAIRLLSLSKSEKLTEMLQDATERPDVLRSTIIYDRERDKLVAGSETMIHDDDVGEKLLSE